jgi:hypothetical protein
VGCVTQPTGNQNSCEKIPHLARKNRDTYDATTKKMAPPSTRRGRSPAGRRAPAAEKPAGGKDEKSKKTGDKKAAKKTKKVPLWAYYLSGLAMAIFIAFVETLIAPRYAFSFVIWAFIGALFFVLFMLSKHLLRVNSNATVPVATISELCRKTNTVEHKSLLVLAVGCGSLLSGFYYVMLLVMPNSLSLRLNFLGSMLLLLTGTFPISSPVADKRGRGKTPGTKRGRVLVFNYWGSEHLWIPAHASSLLHTTGIASYVVLSVWADIRLHRYLLSAGIALFAVLFAFFKSRGYYSGSVFLEALLVMFINASHAYDVWFVTHHIEDQADGSGSIAGAKLLWAEQGGSNWTWK